MHAPKHSKLALLTLFTLYLHLSNTFANSPQARVKMLNYRFISFSIINFLSESKIALIALAASLSASSVTSFGDSVNENF
jgi:hypothetical protein